ncbi:EF-hand domain-containing protein [Nitratireductor sp. XY-223]|uniref:EF-hand domain-containing protein n=1 Tax=Nitratireductor sp. XY-223 TaxID=2561926 RepID=UPI0010AA8874|nr:EF-hand domain-containing protein [Nitratireductor sp. XY-223]
MSKKTESIEIRVSPELKERVSVVSARRGLPTSRLIRQLLEREVSAHAQYETDTGVPLMKSINPNRVATFGVSAAALLALAFGWNMATQNNVAAQADVRVAFAEMDVDGDGVISSDEFSEYLGIEQEDDVTGREDKEVSEVREPEDCDEEQDLSMDGPLQNFAAFDGDGNGRIDYTELENAFASRHTKTFKDYDTDKSGYLIHTELVKGLAADGVFARLQCEIALDAQAEEDEEFDAEYEVKVAFAILDENRDNKVSLPEYLNNQPPFGIEF